MEVLSKKLGGKIFRKYRVRFAYLFGSQASKNASASSDYDIAVFLSDKLSKEKRFKIRLMLMEELSRLFKKQTDVVILNDLASLFFKYIILSEGRIIYEKSEAERVDYENYVLSLYFDFQPFLNLYNQQYVKNNI